MKRGTKHVRYCTLYWQSIHFCTQLGIPSCVQEFHIGFDSMAVCGNLENGMKLADENIPIPIPGPAR
ncbi:hypothetical protein [Burkholderia plantarii]|uniref:hypothetical protein n=1 Tax=Burkholderia plantarii TaxID=41899 RepID=UPI00114D352D|nr:hypothetical protein [Burkholderia plantarii]WLE62360.1 hypothetical protein GIY62_33815 [Burkholderia plantarii]